jgi:hypothetical protein
VCSGELGCGDLGEGKEEGKDEEGYDMHLLSTIEKTKDFVVVIYPQF